MLQDQSRNLELLNSRWQSGDLYAHACMQCVHGECVLIFLFTPPKDSLQGLLMVIVVVVVVPVMVR